MTPFFGEMKKTDAKFVQATILLAPAVESSTYSFCCTHLFLTTGHYPIRSTVFMGVINIATN